MNKEINKILIAGTEYDIRDSRFDEASEAETARQTAETARQEAEQGRVTAEQAREDAEAARAEEFASFEGTLAAKEDAANKVTSLDNPNDVTYPTSKAVHTAVENAKDSIGKMIQSADDDNFYFSDSDGNYIAQVRKDGITANGFNIFADGKEQKVDLDKLKNVDELNMVVQGGTDDNFYFADKGGNYIAQVSKDGITAKGFFNTLGINVAKAYIHPANGKMIYGFGDSHFNASACKTILEKLQEITGCRIDHIKNSQCGIIYTGNPDSQIFKDFEYAIDTNARSLRALRKRVDDGIMEEPGYILLEQTHPTFADTIEAEPFVGTQMFNYNTSESAFASKSNMQQELGVSILNYIKGIGSAQRKSGTSVKVFFKNISKTLTFSSSGNVKVGSFTLNIGEHSFTTSIESETTLNDALTAMNHWQFGDTCNWANKNPHSNITNGKIVLDYIGSETSPSVEISLTDNGTGISLTSIEDSESVSYNYLLFAYHDMSKWEIIGNWYINNGTNDYDNGYSMLKGVIEIGQKLFPKARIVLWYPNSLNLESMVWHYPDGSLDYYKTRNNNIWSKWEVESREAWKQCAELYNIKFINVSALSGISFINYDTYYNAGIHPTQEVGYTRWAQIIAENL